MGFRSCALPGEEDTARLGSMGSVLVKLDLVGVWNSLVRGKLRGKVWTCLMGKVCENKHKPLECFGDCFCYSCQALEVLR